MTVEALDALVREVSACFACGPMAHCHTLGRSNGPPDARVLFVGEAPGRLGAGRSGVPFEGDQSGRRFETLLAAAGLERRCVFVTNAVLCNPLDASGRNRRPLISEVARCLPFLRQQIEAVDADFVVALGGVALAALARLAPHGLSLRRDCGRPLRWHGRTLVPLYHPGRRALVHRPEGLQLDDWRRLGEIVSASRR
jgi:uracil-DNA glycosylase family 4